MTDHFFAAADLGATSGRVILGRLCDGQFSLSEVHRFPTTTFTQAEHLHLDAAGLFADIVQGVREAQAQAQGRLLGVAVDTWGVDYGLLRNTPPLSAQETRIVEALAAQELVEPPYNYRDTRAHDTPASFFAAFPAAELYAQCGLQVMEFNTVFQLACSAGDPSWRSVDHALFLPDLFSHFLSGEFATELTIASTSGLLNAQTRAWSPSVTDHLRGHYGLDVETLFPPIVEPGTVVGRVRPEVVAGEVSVIAVGAHDTASAIVSIPARTRDFAYVSSGTWSLVGLELDSPVLTEESRTANFSNELGVDGTVRYLKNVMGLWVLTESQRQWAKEGHDCELLPLLDAASRLPALTTVVDMEDPRLLPPGDMPSRLADMARETGQPVPTTPAEFTRCILDSLAVGYRRAIRMACHLADRDISVVHVVGGGCRNALLNQLTAEAVGLPVIAGPAEGTALGNLLVQARALGALQGSLLDLRAVSANSCETQTYAPGVLDLPQAAWDDAQRRAFGG
ncbi:MAG: rhamnulokinase [Propionibacteriaceae bacterium]|jgi:rhamnulokinase|nr:rhamnulokinase [Propionibacteriaceae bacterium]